MDEPLGTKDARVYVSAAIHKRGKHLQDRGVQHYIDRGAIPSRLIGKTRIFTKSDLDAFVENYIKADVKPGPKRGSHHSHKAL